MAREPHLACHMVSSGLQQLLKSHVNPSFRGRNQSLRLKCGGSQSFPIPLILVLSLELSFQHSEYLPFFFLLYFEIIKYMKLMLRIVFLWLAEMCIMYIVPLILKSLETPTLDEGLTRNNGFYIWCTVFHRDYKCCIDVVSKSLKISEMDSQDQGLIFDISMLQYMYTDGGIPFLLIFYFDAGDIKTHCKEY